MKKLLLLLFIPAMAHAYDSAGNITTNHATFDAANRILSDDNYAYAHDANGNMTQKVSLTNGTVANYFYNSENQLVLVNISGKVIVKFLYDALGRRIQKSVTRDGSTETKYYFYDESNIIAILNEQHEPLAIFTHGPGIDEPLSMNCPKEGKTYHFHADALGSIIAVTDENADVVERIEYSAFGIPYFVDVRDGKKIVSNASFTQSPYAFTGREWDPEIELYYYRARYYSPYLGRFIQEDPIHFKGGDTNFYTYVGNNPVNRTDPFGFHWFRQDWQEPGKVGRPNTLVPPNGRISQFIENNLIAGYTFGEMHDAFVDIGLSMQLPDWFINIPSMPYIYPSAQIVETLRSIGILKQPTPHKKGALCK